MSSRTTEQELIDAKHYCRDIQVLSIIEEAAKDFTDKSNEIETYKWLGNALITPPIYFPLYLQSLRLTRDEFFDKVQDTCTDGAVQGKVLGFLGDLYQACGFENRRISEVAVDVDTDLPTAYQILYSDRLDALKSIVTQASSQAVVSTLAKVAGETPLMRYRRDLIVNRVELVTTFGGKVGSLPTKIPNVDVRYFYPHHKVNPILSFVVKPFD